VSYANVGSFRGNYLVRRSGSTVTVIDRAGFERSQFTTEKSYRPLNGSYFKPGTQTLLDPVEVTLALALASLTRSPRSTIRRKPCWLSTRP